MLSSSRRIAVIVIALIATLTITSGCSQDHPEIEFVPVTMYYDESGKTVLNVRLNYTPDIDGNENLEPKMLTEDETRRLIAQAGWKKDVITAISDFADSNGYDVVYQLQPSRKGSGRIAACSDALYLYEHRDDEPSVLPYPHNCEILPKDKHDAWINEVEER